MIKLTGACFLLAVLFLQTNGEINVAGWEKNARDFVKEVTKKMKNVDQRLFAECSKLGLEGVSSAEVKVIEGFNNCTNYAKMSRAKAGLELGNIPFKDSALSYWGSKRIADGEETLCFQQTEKSFHQSMDIMGKEFDSCITLISISSQVKDQTGNLDACIHMSIPNTIIQRATEKFYLQEKTQFIFNATVIISDINRTSTVPCFKTAEGDIKVVLEKSLTSLQGCERAMRNKLIELSKTCFSMHKVKEEQHNFVVCRIEPLNNFSKLLSDIQNKTTSCNKKS